MRNQIFVISGPSGSGKTTLLQGLLKTAALKRRLVKSVSFTTRPKRQGERQGKDYFFISESQFKRFLKAKKILEWTRYLGYYYGTPRDSIDGQLEKGRSIGLCLDLRGALKIKRLYPHKAVSIFIAPPSIRELKNRIAKRCAKTPASEIQKRLRLAQEEVKLRKLYDYCLVNKDLYTTIRQLKDIILREIGLTS